MSKNCWVKSRICFLFSFCYISVVYTAWATGHYVFLSTPPYSSNIFLISKTPFLSSSIQTSPLSLSVDFLFPIVIFGFSKSFEKEFSSTKVITWLRQVALFKMFCTLPKIMQGQQSTKRVSKIKQAQCQSCD